MSVDGRVMMSLVMLAIFAGMVGMALTYPPETRLLPLVIGIPGILLGLIQVGMEISAARRRAGPAESTEEDEPDTGAGESPPSAVTVKRELVLLAYLATLAISIILFGFWLTIPVFVIVFLRLHERESWNEQQEKLLGRIRDLECRLDQQHTMRPKGGQQSQRVSKAR